MDLRQAFQRYPRNSFACILLGIFSISAVLWGGESAYTEGRLLGVAFIQFFDLQAIPLLAEANGITDKLP